MQVKYTLIKLQISALTGPNCRTSVQGQSPSLFFAVRQAPETTHLGKKFAVYTASCRPRMISPTRFLVGDCASCAHSTASHVLKSASDKSHAQRVCFTTPEGYQTAALTACTLYMYISATALKNPGKTGSVEHDLRGCASQDHDSGKASILMDIHAKACTWR